ncbi:MAG: hypothetical protein PV340_02150 [Wolbachia sp.]|nr:hypothetical protein [Wolbachia sp.]MDD9335950.1 hypothetical protein [Wolbachia sp.]
MFLNKPGDLTGRSDAIKQLAEQTNKKIVEIDSKAEELKKEIVRKFCDDVDSRNIIYMVIEETINQRNERNINSPENQKVLFSIEDLFKEENKKRSCDDIEEDLKSCSLILDINLSNEEYDNTYDSKIIKNSFINNEDLYKTYLEAIKTPTMDWKKSNKPCK